MNWMPIEEAPDNTEMLVKGGMMMDDLHSSYEYDFAHVEKRGDGYHVQNMCYYSAWVLRPTHFIDLNKLKED